MTKLTKATRNKLPAKDFAGPGRTYPVEDSSHARAAIRDSAHAEKVGNISKAVEDEIDSRAHNVLGGRKD